MVELDKYLPVNREEAFRNGVNKNFAKIEQGFSQRDAVMANHQTTQKNAHNSKQIKHVLWDVEQELKYRAAQVSNLVIGANGDGISEVKDSRVSLDANVHGTLSERLLSDFKRITQRLDRVVHVDDFGAVADGKTDSTQAFVDAMGSGNVQVNMSAGTYIVNEILVPNNTHLQGQGHAITKIKLHDDAPASAINITNKVMEGKAENIAVTGLTLDWNKKRQGGLLKPTGGSRSSTLRFAGVRYGYASDVFTTGSALHGIDVTHASDAYFYGGDGARVDESLESQYITIINCDATDFGDDGITTHNSRYLKIINSGGHHTHGTGNSNGIEIDEGSQYVTLSNTYSEECFAGIEIKAHATSSAASNIFVDGHTSTRDCRSFNFRHIGHHHVTDPDTKTAFGILARGLVSIKPYANEVYKGYTPRSLVASAYINVNIIGFTAIGDATFTTGEPVMTIQFKSKNISISGINITGFVNASYDIMIYGGDNRGEGITLSDVNIYKSAKTAIYNGGGVYDTKLIGGSLTGNGQGAAIESMNNTMQIIGVTQKDYAKAATIGGVDYAILPTVINGGVSIASTAAAPLSETAAVIASTGSAKASGNRSVVIACADETNAAGSRTVVAASSNSETVADGFAQTILSSKGVKTKDNYQTVFGYGEGPASTANMKVTIDSSNGNIKSTGTITGSSSLSDFAEYFETENGDKIEVGTIVTLKKGYVKIAEKGDKIIGAISGTAGIILGANTYHHKDKYLKTKFGEIITEKVEVQEETEAGIKKIVMDMPVINPDYNAEFEENYQSREIRKEWNIVGLKGQLFVKVEKSVSVDDYISGATGGVGAKSTDGWQVMEITHPFDEKDGYAVAKVLI